MFEAQMTDRQRPRGVRGLFWRVRLAAAFAAYWAAAKLHAVGFALDPRPPSPDEDDDSGSGGNYL